VCCADRLLFESSAGNILLCPIEFDNTSFIIPMGRPCQACQHIEMIMIEKLFTRTTCYNIQSIRYVEKLVATVGMRK
jgi:hypothetical protein